ncbi:MAG: alpha/beta fold hydrolase [Polyangiales bacterium]
MNERMDVTFASAGETCAGWWYEAPGAGPHPVVVMGHGLGGTRELGLDPYARRFQAAGISVLAFDYRHYGRSTGEPRELLSVSRQLADFRAAITYARTRSNVDGTRIAIWGSSFGGGHVMSLAAEELGLRAGVAQVPFSNGLASLLQIPIGTAIRVTFAALLDMLRALLGLPPHYIALVGRPGEVALMSAADSYDGYLQLVPPEAARAERWRNRVSARTGLAIPLYFPDRKLTRARIPVFVAVAEHDTIAPASPTVRAAERTPSAQLARYPSGHFDYYQGDGFERVLNDELTFLRAQLGL